MVIVHTSTVEQGTLIITQDPGPVMDWLGWWVVCLVLKSLGQKRETFA